MRHRHKGGRICTGCGNPYYRSNRFRVWTAINPGHRMGWQKEEAVMCCKCFNARQAQRVMTMAQVEVQPVRLRAVR